jgi:L-amino acid N-acyltransferase YncA
MIFRDAAAADIAAIAAIYGDACLNGLGTFEEVPPTVEEMAQRLSVVQNRGLPYLVAEEGGEVLGFAYAAPFRLRAAYRYTVEDSVYVAPQAKGRGLGKALLAALVEACEAMGLRQMMAVIGDSGNEGSIGVHQSVGFAHAGLFRDVGYKHGRWVDIVLMQRPLGPGSDEPPDTLGLALSGV